MPNFVGSELVQLGVLNDESIEVYQVYLHNSTYIYGFITHRIHVWYIYAKIWGILMVNVTIYSVHGSYGL